MPVNTPITYTVDNLPADRTGSTAYEIDDKSYDKTTSIEIHLI